MGSEMCIRDRPSPEAADPPGSQTRPRRRRSCSCCSSTRPARNTIFSLDRCDTSCFSLLTLLSPIRPTSLGIAPWLSLCFGKCGDGSKPSSSLFSFPPSSPLFSLFSNGNRCARAADTSATRGTRARKNVGGPDTAERGPAKCPQNTGLGFTNGDRRNLSTI